MAMMPPVAVAAMKTSFGAGHQRRFITAIVSSSCSVIFQSPLGNCFRQPMSCVLKTVISSISNTVMHPSKYAHAT